MRGRAIRHSAMRLLLLTTCCLVACSPGIGADAGTGEDAGTTDAGKKDAGSTDAGSTDAGSPDAGSPDAGAADAGLDAGTTDAGRTDAGSSRFWDGGSCAVKTDCPCFSSDDCAPTFWCHSEDSTGTKIFCIPGSRGPGAAGAACVGETDCASALCIDSSTAGQRCSAVCDKPADCPSSLPKCTYVGFGVDRSLCSP